ncbi:uncharacterized protein LOC126981314 isoform X3 [Eriocheir sinensis]|uniref:uncharacterized protein LOC126981314 isoform X3 n=1 Tax=Eriocheir sinensis TaxID=95602 RepID=UPI0021CA470F|nr:uncharacterized protein LOC126981314 isoform X3 [Eriocheir sinensis]
MAVIRYLVWTVLLAALARATTECLDDHHCTVGLNLGLMNPNETLGFLVPQLCCREVRYPFTFLAHFFNISDYTVTFRLHEYYLLDVEVRVCRSAFYDTYDDDYYHADDDAVQSSCVDDYPYRCITNREVLAASILRYRTWSESGYLNITIPVKPRPVLQAFGNFTQRPAFNITYERRRLGEPGRIADEENIANLDMCSFNGYPVLTPVAKGEKHVYVCQCNNDASGEKCEWGGRCQPHDLTSPCSGHGECRYYRGAVKCTCDEDHFGNRCEHNASSAQPFQLSVCREMNLECSHLCSLAGHPRCLCPPHLVLLNKTHCTPRGEQLVNVTVKLLDDHHHHTLADQVSKILEKVCISVMEVRYHDNSKEFHFTMNKKQQDFLPGLSDWSAALNSSVTINITKQDNIWLGPLNKTERDGKLMLQCTVFGASLPLNVSWFIGQHQIYTLEVNSCEGSKVDSVITVEFMEQSLTKCPNDTRCMDDTRTCFSETSCTMKLLADKYNPDLDRGDFRVVVSQGDTNAAQRVVVDSNPQAVVMVTPFSVSMYKNGSTTLHCTISGDWKWNKDCEIKWIFPVDSAVFVVETPKWNVSHLNINHLKQSISVTCEVTFWEFCDDRRSRTQSVCVAPGCNSDMADVYYLETGMLLCPEQMDGTVFWHTTPVGKTAFANCSQGFEGVSRRECKQDYNNTAVWAEADYYGCVYQPFHNLIQRTPMLYLKKGFHVAMDPNIIMEELGQLFGAREEKLNPWEHTLIQEQVKYLFRLSAPPVDSQVFLGLLDQIWNKTAINDTWQLEPLIRMYLSLEMDVRGPSELDDLSLWRTDIPAQQEVANITIEYSEGHPKKRLHLKVVMPQGDRKRVRVGAFVFLDPKRIPVGRMNNTNTTGWVFDHNLSGPVVEVVVMVPTEENVTAFTENFTLNWSYFDPNVTTDRNEKCGGAKVPTSVGEPVLWNLGRCNTLGGQTHRGRRAIKCHCQGPGLFAVIKVPEMQTSESALKRPLVVTLTCCIVVLVLVLCILWLSSVPPVPAFRRRFLLGQCNACSTLLTHLKSRITHCIPCCAANLENTADPNDKGITIELMEGLPSCSKGSSRDSTLRRRTMEPCPDPSSLRLITEDRCQVSPDTRSECKDYLDMNQLPLANHWYGNIFGLSEAEQVKRWGSNFLLESEYLDASGIQLIPFVKDSESDPDESQS